MHLTSLEIQLTSEQGHMRQILKLCDIEEKMNETLESVIIYKVSIIMTASIVISSGRKDA